MTRQLEVTQSCLDGHTHERRELTGPHRRLVDTWLSDRPGVEIAADVAALASQVLRNERNGEPDGTPILRLKLDDRGISPRVLARSNLLCDRYGESEHQVTQRMRWGPEWISGDPTWIDVACASPGPFRGGTSEEVTTYSRPDTPIPVDPALATIAPDISQYRSKTQASAIRTATLSDPSSTLHIVLPTGSGKSIVGLAPGLLRSGGNTVVVVPTTALALDQERTIHQRFPKSSLPRELAYYGDRTDGGKDAIRQRLRAGTQRVVFASPEALASGLASTLRALAATGTLTSIVLDEAHLIRSWGLDFRPEFQLMGPLVSELRAVAKAAGRTPPHTILLTATLSKEGLELNDTLFHGNDTSLFVGSAFLRTELRYLMGQCDSVEQRFDRLVEAMHHLPRPAIVYVTRKKDADRIRKRLRKAGFARTEAFHGDTKSHERLRILEQWSGSNGSTEVDIVVGTSAFGLGVDQSDVRTVLHACVPASVDRFYQEVGRAGRDGHAAVAVWLPAPGDVHEGRRIEGSVLIGDDKAWNRWESMRLLARQSESKDGALILDTTVVPRDAPAGTQKARFDNEANRLWNRNTLTLMQRAGLVSIEPTPAPNVQRQVDEDESEFEARRSHAWAVFSHQAIVRVSEGLNLNRETFEDRLGQLRQKIRATEAASQSRISQLLSMSKCWAQVISTEYTLRDVGTMHATLSPTPACSGCPAEEHYRRPTFGPAKPIVADASVPELNRNISDQLKALAVGGNVAIVTYSGRLNLMLQNLVQRCVTHGIRGILTSPSFTSHSAVTKTGPQTATEGFVIVDTLSQGVPQVSFSVPTLVILAHDEPALLPWVSSTTGPLRITVVHEDTEDPGKSGQLIKDYRTPVWSLDDFLRRL